MDKDYKQYDELLNNYITFLYNYSNNHNNEIYLKHFNIKDESHLLILRVISMLKVYMCNTTIYIDCNIIKYLYYKHILKKYNFDIKRKHNNKSIDCDYIIASMEGAEHIDLSKEVWEEYYEIH